MSKITYNDFFDYSNDRTVKQAIKVITDMETAYKKLSGSIKSQNTRIKSSLVGVEKDMVKLSKTMSNVDLATKKGQETAKQSAKIAEKQSTIYEQQSTQLKENAKQIRALEKEIKKLSKARADTNVKQKKTTQLTKDEIREKVRLQQQTAKVKKELQLEEGLRAKNIGTMEKARLKLRQLTNQRNNLTHADGKNAKELQRLNNLIGVQEKKVKGLSSALERQRLNIGNYKSALGGMSQSMMMLPGPIGMATSSVTMLGTALKSLIATPIGAFVAILVGLGAIIGKAVGNAKDLQDASANLAGVLGTTRQEITALTDEAKRLGATTAFTTEEVIKLQTEYAKLGFAEQDIINMTEATLNLAIISEKSAGEVATFVGSTLRQFGLMSTDAKRVVDVAAKAFSSSALDFEKLSTSLAIVGKAADVSGVSLERTVALLGTLANAGIDASTSATSLRNIFIELGKKGITYEEALSQINGSSDKLLTAFNLFGKRGAVAAIVLAEMSAETKTLEENVIDAGDAAQKFADEKLNTLSGSYTLLKSAWKGLLESIDDGNGIFTSVAKTVVDLTKSVLKAGKWLIDLNGKILGAFGAYMDFIRTVQSKIGLRDVEETAKKTGVAYDNLGDAFRDVNKEAIISQTAMARSAELTEELKKRAEDLEKAQIKASESAKKKTGIMTNLESSLKKLKTAYDEVNLAVSEGDWQKVAFGIKEIDRLLENPFVMEVEVADESGGFSIENYREREEEKTRITQEQKDLREQIEKEANQVYLQAGTAAINGLFDIHQASLMNEMNMVRLQRDYELTLAGDNADEQYKIKKRFERKEAEIRKKQAKADKMQALFNIANNTGVAIIKVATSIPFPAAIPLMIAMGVLGAVQLAITAARPIPQFAEGTENSPEGLAVVGEKGIEVGIKDGKATVYDKPTLTYLKRGTQIIPNNELDTLGTREDIIGMNNSLAHDIRIQHDERMINQMSKAMSGNADTISRAIKNKAETSIVIDNEGIHKQIKRGSLWDKYLEENFYN